MEQTVDIPVPRGRAGRVGGRGLQGFRPGQNSTAFGGGFQFRAVEVFNVLARDRFQLLHPLTHVVLRMKFLQFFFARTRVGTECGL